MEGNIYTDEFVKLICDRLGIVVNNYQKNDLSKTIKNACEKFNCSASEYLNLIKHCPSHSPLLEHLVAGVTIGETYFFRDKKQIDLLKKHLLPTIIQSKRKENNFSIRIWSAGCSSGEEIYTIAMLIYELVPDIEKWTLNLLGTDINTNSLNKAIAGVYNEWSMRSTDGYFKETYFHKKHNTYVIVDKIRERVKFDYLNLNDNSYPSIFNGTNAQDLILCRNVLIYFDSNKIKKLMSKLSNSLNLEGYLLLGASDPIELSETKLEFQHNYGMLFSRKTIEPVIKEKVILADSIKKEIKIEKPTLVAKPIDRDMNKILETTKVSNHLIAKLLNESKWSDILSILEMNNDTSSYLMTAKAVSLANLGKLEEAIQIFQKVIKHDPTNKHAYFTYALTLIEMNKLQQAEKLLRITLYLDNQFVVAHYQLRLLLLRNKQHDSGLKCLKNALAIVSTKNPEQEVSESPGLSYERLSEILKYEIDIYSKEKERAHV